MKNFTKYFKPPKGIIKNAERWKYNLAEILKSMFYACLIIALGASAIATFLFALLTPDY